MPDVLRLFFLSAHYRNPVDYTEKAIENADSALQGSMRRWRGAQP